MSPSLAYCTREKKKGRVTFLTFIEISLVEIALGQNHCLGGERKLCLKKKERVFFFKIVIVGYRNKNYRRNKRLNNLKKS